MSVTPTWAIQAKFDGTAWTAITTDVLQSVPIRVRAGIFTGKLDDRVADTGYMTFALDNSASNSAGSLGYYTPGHTNCREGFGRYLPVRCQVTYNGTTQTKFYGRIADDGIYITTGTVGNRRSYVTVFDWMQYPASQELGLIPYSSNRVIGDVVGSVAAYMPVAPLTTDYETGFSHFDAMYDPTGAGLKGLTELSRVANSELGYVYVTRNASNDEVLRAENRHTRNEAMFNEESIVTLDNSTVEGESEIGEPITTVTFKIYPRSEDTSLQILYSSPNAIRIPASGTTTVTGRYRDPDNEASYVSAKNMQPLVENSDYIANSAEDGSGTNYSGSLTVTTTFGANSAEFVLSNAATIDIYATTLQCRGIGLYSYTPVQVSAVGSAPTYPGGGGQTTNPKIQELYIDMRYQDDPEEAQIIADYLLDKIDNAPEVKFRNVTFYANASATLMDAFLRADIGSLVKIEESMSGASEDTYFINGIDFEIIPTNIIRCTWHLMWDVAPAAAYWILGVAGRSELGSTANPAP